MPDSETDADPMPIFVIKGKDRLALDAIRAYRVGCEQNGLTQQAEEVDKAHREMWEWQQRNPDALQLPDHPHVPVASVTRPNAEHAHTYGMSCPVGGCDWPSPSVTAPGGADHD